MMTNRSVTKVDTAHAPHGREGQRYLASGVRMGMRLWEAEEPGNKAETSRDYEVIGYVISGRALLHIEGQTVTLEPGDSYVVPRNARHAYDILESFTAVEVTCPPSYVHGRDD